MPQYTIWIRYPYPFRWEEMRTIEQTLNRTYGVTATYFREYAKRHGEAMIDYVQITGDMTQHRAGQLANTLLSLHWFHAQRDTTRDSRCLALDVQVEIRQRYEGSPEWARIQEGKETQ